MVIQEMLKKTSLYFLYHFKEFHVYFLFDHLLLSSISPVGEEGECFAPHSHGSERAPRFSSSKRPPETKASLNIWFQTMRNSILLTNFLPGHGILCSETDFGPILAPFWIEISQYLSECFRIYQKSNILSIYDTRSIARASFHDFTPPPKSRFFMFSKFIMVMHEM